VGGRYHPDGGERRGHVAEDAERGARRLAAGDGRARVAEGNAAKVLIDLSGSADLLVVGCRGYGGFSGLLLGSVSQQVVAHAQCSVVVVR
jgi:nucleotide-binding universal stress UspA family protein